MTENLIKKWYIVHTYSGHEYRVKRDLEERIENLRYSEFIPSVIVPDEERVEVRNKKKKVLKHKFFPGYVMVQVLVEPVEIKGMSEYKMDNNVWYTIRNTPGVSGFVGAGYYPTPLSEDEANKILQRMDKAKDNSEFYINAEDGDSVEVVGGPFEGSYGTVESIDRVNGRMVVVVDVFNRKTPIEVSFEEVQVL